MSSYGSISTITMSDEEKDLYAEYLSVSIGNPVLEFVKYMLGDDYLKFIDICSGTNFNIPSNKALERGINNVKMYAYVKKWNFSNASIVNAGNIYKKTELATRRIVLSVANALGVKDTLEGEALVNFVENIEPYAVKKNVENSSDSVIGDNDTSEVSEDGNV
jgi:hypothetical protein|nr:MAG TPA: hypothetical protein [Caudoviricetes sp.]DAW12067.1 MAG TPA: hypothetical protein [Caudoviricetes sp.]